MAGSWCSRFEVLADPRCHLDLRVRSFCYSWPRLGRSAMYNDQQQEEPNEFGRKPGPATGSCSTPPVPLPPPPRVEQKPPQPRTVAWDGKQLTIDADNSRLTSILLAVRERTRRIDRNPRGGLGEESVRTSPSRARQATSSSLCTEVI